MANVQAHRRNSETTVSFLARAVACRPRVVQTDPQYPATPAKRKLAAATGEACRRRTLGAQVRIGVPEIGAYRCTGWRLGRPAAAAFVDHPPAFDNMATAPMAAR